MTRQSISVGQGRAKQATPPSTPAPSMDETGPETDRSRREARRPFGSHVQRLAYPKRLDYYRHWFNDRPGRILDAEAAGYKHVIDPETGDKVKRVVGVSETGGVLMGYLMETPQEWFDGDMAAGQSMVDDRERSIRVGADNEGQPGVDGRYIPARGISVKTK